MDWESCFHCGAREPVSRPAVKRILDAAMLFIVVGTIATMGVRVGTVWGAVRVAPERLLAEVVRNAGAHLAPSVPEVDPAVVPTVAVTPLATTPLAATARGATPLAVGPEVALATLAEKRPVAAGDSAARIFDEARIARAIDAATTLAALDSLEARLRADYPRDPRLRRTGRAGRRLAARRASLAGRSAAN
jgi:hypothetical protein